ncbi:unnamed protein product [Caenorhabditis auriculariae]|uniref:Uncharacterized protein n=1 Tax=Caenorhabditis auriculariae TaxID=2777116 RepID=A0A8S1H8F0_9PELO|nr:unnamed protein product [Caenorhabditis auriculariae]
MGYETRRKSGTDVTDFPAAQLLPDSPADPGSSPAPVAVRSRLARALSFLSDRPKPIQNESDRRSPLGQDDSRSFEVLQFCCSLTPASLFTSLKKTVINEPEPNYRVPRAEMCPSTSVVRANFSDQDIFEKHERCRRRVWNRLHRLLRSPTTSRRLAPGLGSNPASNANSLMSYVLRHFNPFWRSKKCCDEYVNRSTESPVPGDQPVFRPSTHVIQRIKVNGSQAEDNEAAIVPVRSDRHSAHVSPGLNLT